MAIFDNIFIIGYPSLVPRAPLMAQSQEEKMITTIAIKHKRIENIKI